MAVTPELQAIECVLADLFREVSTAARLADMAGLDVTQLDRTGSTADVWHGIVTAAVQEGVVDALLARARQEHPRNAELAAAAAAWRKALGASRPRPRGTRQGQDRDAMSDYRSSADARIDQMMRDMNALNAQLTAQVTQLTGQVAQLSAQVAQLNATVTRLVDDNESRPALSNTQLGALLLAILATALVILSLVYGGRV